MTIDQFSANNRALGISPAPSKSYNPFAPLIAPQNVPLKSTISSGGTPSNTTTTVPPSVALNSVPQPSAPSIPSTDFDAAFAPAFDSLNQATDYLNNSAFPTAISDISTQKKSLVGTLDTQKQGTDQQFLTDQDTLLKGRQNALDQVIRNNNILARNAQTRFGGSSSAGQAVSEIVGQETARQAGGIEQTFGTQLGELIGKNTDLNRYYAQKKVDIDDWESQQLQKARDWLSQQLGQIVQQRNTLESQKSQQKLSALQSAIDWSKQLSAVKYSAQIQLESLRAQQQALLDSQFQQLNKNVQTDASLYTPWMRSTIQTTTPTPVTSSVAPSFNPNTKVSLKQDDWENPFFTVA